MSSSNQRLVYSSDLGRICLKCQKSMAECICKETARQAPLGDGNVILRRETKGRGGKTVIVVSGLALSQSELQTLVGELKRLCGTGGTSKDGVIEIQGEHLDKIREALKKRGYRPKG